MPAEVDRSGRVRRLWPGLPPGGLVAIALTAGLAAITASSVAHASWVGNLDGLWPEACLAVLVTLVIERLRAPGWAAVPLLTAALAVVLLWMIHDAAVADGIGDQYPRALPGALLGWGQQVASGRAEHGSVVFLGGLVVATWAASAWLGWFVFRRSRGLVALLPGSVMLAVNAVDSPTQETFYVLVWVALAAALLATCHYASAALAAGEAGRTDADARFDFLEAAGAAVAVLAIVPLFLPSATSQDFTADANSRLGSLVDTLQEGWHSAFNGVRDPGGGTTGFGTEARGGGPLQRSDDVVLRVRYLDGSEPASPGYLQGAVLTSWDGARWTVDVNRLSEIPVPSGGDLYGPDGLDRIAQRVEVSAVAGGPAVAFTPSGPTSVSNPVLELLHPTGGLSGQEPEMLSFANGGRIRGGISVLRPTFGSVPFVEQLPRPRTYTVGAAPSAASVDELRAAPRALPAWVTVPAPDSAGAVPALARCIVTGAGTCGAPGVPGGLTAPAYDQARAIEAWLRSTPFQYDLNAPAPPAGVDPLQFFLFESHRGYCEYFASSMGVMVRSLGIPVRVVNGFGPGQFDGQSGQWVVRQYDAHTWVEVYFTNYGWIPFEPTPDPHFPPIDRLQHQPSPAGPATPAPTVPRGSRPRPEVGTDPGTAPAPSWLVVVRRYSPGPWAGLGLAPPVALVVALLAWWWRPRDVRGAWRRLTWAGRRSGLPLKAAETPAEYSHRLSTALPALALPLQDLADSYNQVAFSAGHRSETGHGAWSALRGPLLAAAWRRPGRLRRSRRTH
ncbi:MAG: DUF3488 and transglutaminase-like domain-containing protein [Candidatus Dormibacteria bacterium]